jgi:hypothetical protein
MKRLAPILIVLSGKKKSTKNRMSQLSVMHTKYKEQLKDDPEHMKRLALPPPGRSGHLSRLPEFVWPRWRLRLPSRPILGSRLQLHAPPRVLPRRRTGGSATRLLQARFRSSCARAISSCASSSPGAPPPPGYVRSTYRGVPYGR